MQVRICRFKEKHPLTGIANLSAPPDYFGSYITHVVNHVAPSGNVQAMLPDWACGPNC